MNDQVYNDSDGSRHRRRVRALTASQRWLSILAAGSAWERTQAKRAACRVYDAAQLGGDIHRLGEEAAAQLSRRRIDTALFWAAIALLESASFDLLAG